MLAKVSFFCYYVKANPSIKYKYFSANLHFVFLLLLPVETF